MPGAVDQFNVDMFEVLCRRVVNDWRGIGAARRARGEEEKCGQGNPKQVHRHSSFIDASSSGGFRYFPGASAMAVLSLRQR
jgi:hypothetical protein